MDTRPNHTVYINNLNEKVKKEGESVGSSRELMFITLYHSFDLP